FVTRFGVSVLKVVATIDTPMSHHGAARPEVKNSAVLRPARRASTTAGANEIAIETTTIVQSSVVGCIARRALSARGARYCPASPRASRPRTARGGIHAPGPPAGAGAREAG